MKPFDLITRLSSSKEYNWSEEEDSAYNSFLANRNFSQFYDTFAFANEMNTLAASKLCKKMQHDFFYHVIQPKKKRFASWGKQKKDESIDLISKYHKCSKLTAEQYSKIYTEADLDEIRTKLDTGGRR
jgi:hypothetical protein